MNDSFCTKCGAKLAGGEMICHSCGCRCQPPIAVSHLVSPRRSAHVTKKSALTQPVSKRTWLIVKTSAGVIILLIFIKACSSEPPVPPNNQADEAVTAIKVRSQCEDYVRKYLKSPSTAEFSGVAETTVYGKGNHKYTAIGWVDSENSFGAKLRTNYACTVTDEGNDQWSFEPLVTNDGGE